MTHNLWVINKPIDGKLTNHIQVNLLSQSWNISCKQMQLLHFWLELFLLEWLLMMLKMNGFQFKKNNLKIKKELWIWSLLAVLSRKVIKTFEVTGHTNPSPWSEQRSKHRGSENYPSNDPTSSWIANISHDLRPLTIQLEPYRTTCQVALGHMTDRFLSVDSWPITDSNWKYHSKPLCSWNLERVASITRERCGGAGYLSCSRFGTFIGLAHAAMTAEGDNSGRFSCWC